MKPLTSLTLPGAGSVLIAWIFFLSGFTHSEFVTNYAVPLSPKRRVNACTRKLMSLFNYMVKSYNGKKYK